MGKRRKRANGLNRETFSALRGGKRMSTQLDRIVEKARLDRKLRFTSLAHLITPEFLKETWWQMNRRGASGVDGETCQQFEAELDKRVIDLCTRLRKGRYQAPPVRRVDIPKGEGKTRPLGIPCVEDRLVQRGVARILEAIFEADFLECSHGFRPKRSPHTALCELRRHLVTGKVRHVVEVDIRGFFNNINHGWLRRMLRERIADTALLRLIDKWLKAGVMETGVVRRNEEGTPQGGPISPILANVYLHFALDHWFEKRFKRHCQGEAYLTRFADDFVACFQYKRDAEQFHRALGLRLEKFRLEVAEEKTRILQFGRFARTDKQEYAEKPDTFVFLGFKHVCGVDRRGKFALVRIPSQKSCRKFLDSTHEWLVRHRHWKRRDQQKQLRTMLNGFYQYFGLYHCQQKLEWVLGEVKRQWAHQLRRRSQWHRMYWSFLKTRAWFELPYPKTLHPAV